MTNAINFSFPDTKVAIKTEKLDGGTRVSITDCGPGIPKDFYSLVFQKISQVDSSDSRKRAGTGLGLSISKAIVEKFGGRLGFESEQDKGSTFYMDLQGDEKSLIPLQESLLK